MLSTRAVRQRDEFVRPNPRRKQQREWKQKDWLTLVAILVTLVFSLANLIYSIWNSRRTSFVNTVTASRLKWIDSLRDKVSEFIAVTTRLADDGTPPEIEKAQTTDLDPLLLQRDTLLHQIILHLNPNDPEDQRIRTLAERVKKLSDIGIYSEELAQTLRELRDATGAYLKKEWTRVKKESQALRA